LSGNGNGALQGWIRLGLGAASAAAALMWAAAEIKSDIRNLDTRVTIRLDQNDRRMDSMDKGIAELRAAAEQSNDRMDRRVRSLEEKRWDWQR
jgi:hypothetical protein